MDDVEQIPRNETGTHNNVHLQEFENDPMEYGEIWGDSSCYKVLLRNILVDVIGYLIGFYYVEGGRECSCPSYELYSNYDKISP